MPNTYTQIHIQFIFAVKYRNAVIASSWEDELYKYITGIVQNNKHKMLCINGMPDHVHLLIGFKTIQSIADLMQDVKSSSSKWINDSGFTKSKFEWQDGYGGFSYSKSQIDRVVKYINNQKEHHKRKTFLEEYINFLEKFEVDYKPEYVFKQLV